MLRQIAVSVVSIRESPLAGNHAGKISREFLRPIGSAEFDSEGDPMLTVVVVAILSFSTSSTTPTTAISQQNDDL
jgi:hypothetical protein